ncbi:hypothetical protein [Aeromonas cavernicola]|uniref:Lipoprotein n=1 Tax=Aeromonas cavernicola TaxID=1006623 RepID=A0A2H9U5V1_9GAMM|nr:hypothetical protein [Aeromonas cavernicola]PJG59369.1 hypothetical protein CUC53_07630 [Aeromonas cavernicola]
MKRVKITYLGAILLIIGCGDNSPSIHKWKGIVEDTGNYAYVIRNPPKTQSGLVSLIISYIKNDKDTPLDFLEGEHSIYFYQESNVTPIDGDRPKASWWEQPMTDPAITYSEIDEYKIASARYLKNKQMFRVFLRGEYWRFCAVRDNSIVDIHDDGRIDPLCD